MRDSGDYQFCMFIDNMLSACYAEQLWIHARKWLRRRAVAMHQAKTKSPSSPQSCQSSIRRKITWIRERRRSIFRQNCPGLQFTELLLANCVSFLPIYRSTDGELRIIWTNLLNYWLRVICRALGTFCHWPYHALRLIFSSVWPPFLSDLPPSFLLFRILVSLIESAQRILCLSKEANELFDMQSRLAEEMKTAEIAPPTVPSNTELVAGYATNASLERANLWNDGLKTRNV